MNRQGFTGIKLDHGEDYPHEYYLPNGEVLVILSVEPVERRDGIIWWIRRLIARVLHWSADRLG